MIKTTLIRSSRQTLNSADLQKCVDALSAGGVIAFPTDTVYGIATNAFHPDGIKKIYALKGRSYHKPLPLLLAGARQVSLVAEGVSPEAHRLIKSFWPGPLTLVLKTAPMASLAARGKNTIAVRVPDHGVVRQILDRVHVPLATTSANRSGHPSLKTGREVWKEFEGKVDVIVDGGPCRLGRESTVVDASHYPMTVLRSGVISKEELSKVLNL